MGKEPMSRHQPTETLLTQGEDPKVQMLRPTDAQYKEMEA